MTLQTKVKMQSCGELDIDADIKCHTIIMLLYKVVLHVLISIKSLLSACELARSFRNGKIKNFKGEAVYSYLDVGAYQQ